jgi:adenine phosphoribosyltransferase
VDRFRGERLDYVVGVEARGYMFAAPLAYALGAGFVPVRKPGKLPSHTITESYTLEYGTNSLEIHDDAVRPGSRVLVVDDLLATGGTAAATVRLVRALKAEVVGVAFLIELAGLGGRTALSDTAITAFLAY